MVDANQFRIKINDAKTCSNVYFVTKLFVIFFISIILFNGLSLFGILNFDDQNTLKFTNL